MHGAPSVIYPVGRSPFAAAVAAGAWLLGGAALAGWWAHGIGSFFVGVIVNHLLTR